MKQEFVQCNFCILGGTVGFASSAFRPIAVSLCLNFISLIRGDHNGDKQPLQQTCPLADMRPANIVTHLIPSSRLGGPRVAHLRFCYASSVSIGLWSLGLRLYWLVYALSGIIIFAVSVAMAAFKNVVLETIVCHHNTN
jgi:hypothetical protein